MYKMPLIGTGVPLAPVLACPLFSGTTGADNHSVIVSKSADDPSPMNPPRVWRTRESLLPFYLIPCQSPSALPTVNGRWVNSERIAATML
jgi:hypothetical protein